MITVNNAEIKTTSVAIKTLTVNGKQLTLNVFRQIKEENIIDPVALKLNGIPWGTVNYFFNEDKDKDDHSHFQIIWQKEKELKRIVLKKRYSVDVLNGRNHEGKYDFFHNNFYRDHSRLEDICFDVRRGKSSSYFCSDEPEKQSLQSVLDTIDSVKKQIEHVEKGRSNQNLMDLKESLNKFMDNYKIRSDKIKRIELEAENIKANFVDYLNKLNRVLDSFHSLPHLFIAT